MASLGNKQKLETVLRETQEIARNSQPQNTFVPGMIEDYITQVSEKIEGRVTKKLSLEFSRTESRILGALSKLDDFLLKRQEREWYMTVPGTSWNNEFENWEPTLYRSQNDLHPEVELAVRQTSNSADSDQEDTSHNWIQINHIRLFESHPQKSKNFFH